jgi:hypothetical protein
MQQKTSPAKLAAFHAVRAQAVVERYEDAGVVKFRTKYFRYIYE